MEDNNCVRVALRIRPQIPREKIDMCRICTSVTPGEPQVWMGSDKAFTYDYVFDMESTQESIYQDTVERLIEGCFEGYNATVLAYGQTGSGKTYTMGTGFDVEVSEDTVGIIPRAVAHLFQGIRARQEDAREKGQPAPDFKVTAQFMELYNEEIIDLLSETRDPYSNRSGRGIRIHEDSGGGIYTVGVETRDVVSEEDALGCLRMGALSRTTASTQMNVQSSRSHAIFTLHIKQQRLAQPEESETGDLVSTEFETLTAKFHFVDLAGSERLKRTGATGERAREGISINCGLLALGNVISALGDKSRKVSHVPYRDSKLTRLLQDSLGGNSQTLMIACVSPSDRDFMETLNTLKYANRARNIKNKVTVNQDKNSKTISLLRHEIQQLQLELMEYKQGKRMLNADGTEGINDMYHENTMLQSENQNLRLRIKALQETVEFMKTQNVQLQTEKEAGKWITGADGEDAMTQMVSEYLKQIEDLRTKLLESENLCQQLRNRNNPSSFHRASFSPSQVAMTGHYDIRIDGSTANIDNLLQEAKKDVEKREKLVFSRKKLISESEDKDEEKEKQEGENEDDDSSSDSENKENENIEGELAEIQSDIHIKQRLIDELEMSQKRLQTMKQQYEDKLLQLQSRIKATQEERDRVLANMSSSTNKGGEQVQKVKAEYEKKLTNMQKELKTLQVAKREHTKMLKTQGQHEKQLKSLKIDLAEMKKTKVKLMNKMKEDNCKHKELESKRNKEIAQLRKEHRKHQNEISKLQAEKRLKDGVLRRKQEELQALRKVSKNPLSERAAGRLNRKALLKNHQFSPKVAKQRWQHLEKSIDKIVLSKRTIADMEQDMERWLNEREEVRRNMQLVMKKRDRVIMSGRDVGTLNDLEEELENIKLHYQYVDENIQECQTGITQMDSEDVGLLDNGAMLNGLTTDETSYLLQKVVNMAISQSYVAAQKEARIRDLDLRYNQMLNDAKIREELLGHLICSSGIDIMPGIAVEDNHSSGSSESSRATSPSESMFSGSNPMACSVYGVESMNNLSKQITNNKARRKTATTEELLYVNGNPPDVSPIKEQSDSNQLSYRATQPKHPSMNLMSKSLTLPSGTGVENLRLSPTARRKIYSRQESYSPKLERRANNLNWRSGTASGEVSRETSPPSSPTGSKRGGSREENVFSRLTSGTTVSGSQRLQKGRICAYNSKNISKNGPLVCTQIAEGHSKAVLSLAATSSLLFSGSKDRTVKVWDLQCGREIQSLTGHPNNVTCVRYAPRNQLLFTASWNCIKVWDLRVPGPPQCIKTLASSGFSISGAMPVSTPSRTVQLPAGETVINDVVISTSENILYSAVSEKVRVWDLRRFAATGKLSGGHQAAVMCLAIDSPSRDTNTVVTGSKDHTIKVFDVEEARSEALIAPKVNLDPPHYDGIQSLALSGDVLFSGSRDTCIKKWDLSRSELVQNMNSAHKDWVTGLCFLPGKQALLSACRAGYLKLWDVNSCQLLQEIRAHTHAINALATNNQAVFTASNDSSIGIWRTCEPSASHANESS